MNDQTVSPVNTFSYEKITTIICDSALEASVAIANEISEIIRKKNAEGKLAVLGLATGSTPKRIYNELIRLHQTEGLSFKNVVCFNLDEYYQLQSDSSQSYRHYMYEHLFKSIDIDPTHCFIPEGRLEQDQVKMHCDAYEKRSKPLVVWIFNYWASDATDILVLMNRVRMSIPLPD